MQRSTPSDTEAERFRGLVQQFVRSFGLLVATQTPCGHPISVSHAHALMVLLERRDALCAIPQIEIGRALASTRAMLLGCAHGWKRLATSRSAVAQKTAAAVCSN
jgi:hypothetical protein